MAKPNIAGKLKNFARELKEEDKSDVKKSGDKVKQDKARKKESIDGEKASGRKN